MKLKRIALLLGIISSIVAIILNFANIIKWISPRDIGPVPSSVPIIEICYDRRPIFLPSDIEDAIIELNNREPLNYESRSLLDKLEKSLTNKEDKYKISFLISIIDKLTSIQEFKYGHIIPAAFTFKVKNIGLKTAHNLKILFPESGYIEVHMKGSPFIKKGGVDAYIFDSLQPNEEASISYWPSSMILFLKEGEVKASHDNGTVKVIKGCR